jgi:hypothetical protein
MSQKMTVKIYNLLNITQNLKQLSTIMKRTMFFIGAILFVMSCKKADVANIQKKEGILSYTTQSNCGYLLWVDNSMYKMSNENLISDSCKDRIYTNVDVEFEILNNSVPITCPMYTGNTQAQQVRLLKIAGK